MLATLGVSSFYAAAPCLWNSMPTELRDVQSLTIFLNVMLRPTFSVKFFFSVLGLFSLP